MSPKSDESALIARGNSIGDLIRSADLMSVPVERVGELLEDLRGIAADLQVSASQFLGESYREGGEPCLDPETGRHYGLLQQAHYYGRCVTAPGFGFDDAYAALAVETETARIVQVYWRQRRDYDPREQEEDTACDWDRVDFVGEV